MMIIQIKNNKVRLSAWLKRHWLPFTAILAVLTVGLGLVGINLKQPGPSQPAGRALMIGTMPASGTAQQYFAYGNDEFDQGHYEAAIGAYSSAIALKPDYAEAYNNRAYTFMTIQNYASALPDLNEAIALRPNYVNALMNRGDIYNYYYQIDTQRALADYDRVLALDPSHTSLCGHRLLAEHNGWNLGTLGDVLTHGPKAGCEATQTPDD